MLSLNLKCSFLKTVGSDRFVKLMNSCIYVCVSVCVCFQSVLWTSLPYQGSRHFKAPVSIYRPLIFCTYNFILHSRKIAKSMLHKMIHDLVYALDILPLSSKRVYFHQSNTRVESLHSPFTIRWLNYKLHAHTMHNCVSYQL